MIPYDTLSYPMTQRYFGPLEHSAAFARRHSTPQTLASHIAPAGGASQGLGSGRGGDRKGRRETVGKGFGVSTGFVKESGGWSLGRCPFLVRIFTIHTRLSKRR